MPLKITLVYSWNAKNFVNDNTDAYSGDLIGNGLHWI